MIFRWFTNYINSSQTYLIKIHQTLLIACCLTSLIFNNVCYISIILWHVGLKHHPQETMFRLEAFLNIPHVNYSHDVLQAVSHNTNLKNSKDNSSTSSDDLLIREPYSFTHDKEFQKLSRNVLHPSLCLFEKAFGWKIHITTKSEIWNVPINTS